MFDLQRLRQYLLGTKPITTTNPASQNPEAALRVDELPPFSLPTAELMRFDPQVRIGLGARNGLLMQGQVTIEGANPEVTDWVERQWNRIWSSSAHTLLKAKLYGYLPLEVMYRETNLPNQNGVIEFDSLLDRHPKTVQLITHNGKTVGFSIPESGQKTPIEVLAPKALVCSFDAEFGNPYGCALLERAYPAWYEKWMDGGAKKTLRLRMIKDAYIGDIIWYPPDRKVQLSDGREVSWRDIAREMLDNRLSGGAMTLPLIYDRDGNKLMDYTPPQDVSGGTQIFDWKKEVDIEIWKALEMPPEIIEASSRGSGFSGRAIPLMIALSAVQTEFNELVACVSRDILRPVAKLNFGDDQFDIRPRSFVEIYREQFAK